MLVDLQWWSHGVVRIGVIAMEVHPCSQCFAFSDVEVAALWADDTVY